MKIVLTLAAQTGLPYEPTAQQIIDLPREMTSGDQTEAVLAAIGDAWADLKAGMVKDREMLLMPSERSAAEYVTNEIS